MNEGDLFWRPVELEVGQVGYGRLSALGLRIERRTGEWRSTVQRDRLEGADGWQIEAAARESESGREEDEADTRHVISKSQGTVQIRPRLANLPVVVRPSTEVSIEAKEKVTIYVGTPMWVEAEVATVDDLEIQLIDAPLQVLSQTWFGANTRQGELCYAASTRARLHLENIEPRHDVAVTEVTVSNSSRTAIRFDVIKLPAPSLSIYRGPAGWFWTDRISVTQHGAEGPSELIIEGLPSTPGRQAELYRTPRSPAPERTLVSALGSLLPFSRS